MDPSLNSDPWTKTAEQAITEPTLFESAWRFFWTTSSLPLALVGLWATAFALGLLRERQRFLAQQRAESNDAMRHHWRTFH